MSLHLTGVILAAGEGRRLGPLGARRPKACLPLLGRPLIHHHLDLFNAMGVDDVVIVVGHLGEQVQAAAATWAGSPLEIRFVAQPERRGIAHALTCARPRVPDAMIVILGDTYFSPGDLADPVTQLQSGAAHAVLSIRREPDPDRIRRECTVRYSETGRLQAIQEKPQEPFNDLKPCGMYFFTAAIWEAIERTPPSELRGEVEITDAIQTLVDLGRIVGRAASVTWDTNMNVPADVVQTNRVELERLGLPSWVHPEADVAADAVLDNVVVGAGAEIGPGCSLSRVVVLDGVRVPAGTTAVDAILGPGYQLDAAPERCQAPSARS